MLIKIISLLLIGMSVFYFAHLFLKNCHSKPVFKFNKKCSAIIQKYFQGRRLKMIERQLADSVEMLANGLRAGLSLQQSFQTVSADASKPIKEEFASVINQIKIGKSFDDALIDLKKKVPLSDMVILVESVLVLRKTGGNLIETFSTLAETIRERQKISEKIKTLTAQGVVQAVTILCMPPALAIGLYVVASWYIEPLFTTPLGWFFIILGLALQMLGAVWIRKIIAIKV